MSDLVTEDDLEKGGLYPPLANIQNCSVKIATRVAEYAYEEGKSIFDELMMYQLTVC